MSTTQSIELIRKLSNGKPLTEKTATELLDYVANQNGDLATKQDIENVKTDLENKIENVKTHVENKIENVKQDVESKIELVKQDVENKIELVKIDVEGVKKDVEGVKKDVEGVKKDVEGVKKDVEGVKKDVEGVKKDIKGIKKDINWLKWSVATGFAIFTVFLSTVLTVMIYLHSDTKSEMKELRKLIIERTGHK